MPRHGCNLGRWSLALWAWLAVHALAGRADAQVDHGVPPPIADPLAASLESRVSAESVLPGQADQFRVIESQLNALPDVDGAVLSPTFQLSGLLHIDYLYPGQDAASRATVGDAQDGADIRRARLSVRGEASDVIDFALGFDFALAGRPSFLDNYIAVRELPALGNIRVGHFFEPFSLERFTNIRYTTFMERSLVDAFAPARNLGLMAHDTIGGDERGTWAIGWFRTNSDVFGDDFGDRGEQAVTGRMTWLPHYDEASGGRSLVHLGAAYTYRSADMRVVQFSSFPEARAGAPGPDDIPPFVDTGLIPAASDQRLGAELAVIRGPLHVQGEYICSLVDQIGGQPLFFHGAYGFVSYFLTGEHRTYNKQLGILDRVYPFENFFRVRTDEGVETGSGAWEVAARLSFIDLDDRNVRGGTLNNLTLGLHWHLNPYTRVKWEYINSQLNRMPAGDSQSHIFGMRFDVDF